MAPRRIASEAAMLAFGAELAAHVRIGDVIALRGGLGAGKTTLARGLLSALGLVEQAPSPTFAIVQPYAPPDVVLAIAHVDLYRIEAAGEADELGLDEYLSDGALIVEWPERLGDRLWPDALILDIDVADEHARCLTAIVPPAWKDRWPLI
ncbi:MAG: tRNA (adenosine(37)-N6)-threonylcarbamoyltransferase complex ATPase subunit type 1 TsaE [Sphingobium sp.]